MVAIVAVLGFSLLFGDEALYGLLRASCTAQEFLLLDAAILMYPEEGIELAKDVLQVN